MPTVPYQSLPKVGLAPLPNVRENPNAPIEAFGGGVAAQRGTLGDLGPAIGSVERIQAEQDRIAYEEKQRAVTTDFTEGATQWTNYRTHAQTNPDGNGWEDQQGKNAVGIAEKTMFEAKSVANVIREGLGSDEAKAVFDKYIATDQLPQLNQQLQQHEFKQRQVYQKETTQGAIDAKHDLAVQNFSDPLVSEPAITAIDAIVRANGKMAGMPDDWIDHTANVATSQTRLDVMQQMLDQPTPDDIGAKAYLDAHKADFIGKDLVKAERLVQHGSVEGEAVRQADVIMGQSNGDEQKAFDLTKQNITDPAVRVKTEERLSFLFTKQAAAKRVSQDKAAFDGYKVLERNGWSTTSVPQSMRDQMGLPHWENLVTAARTAVNQQAKGGPGDRERHTFLLNESVHDPEAFAARDIPSEQGLNFAQQDDLIKRQAAADRADLAPLRYDVSHARSNEQYYMHKIDAAIASGDTKEAQRLRGVAADYHQQAVVAEEAFRAAQHRTPVDHGGQARTFGPTLDQLRGNQPTSVPTTPAPGGAVVPTTPPDTRKPTNPIGLTAVPLKPLTESMMSDVMRSGGGRSPYADVLRVHGYDVPVTLTPPAPAEKPKPSTRKMVVNRDASGRITDSTITVIKPE